METLLIVVGILLLPAIGIFVTAGVVHWRRGNEILKEIEEWERRNNA